jgi:hypothetical protein
MVMVQAVVVPEDYVHHGAAHLVEELLQKTG